MLDVRELTKCYGRHVALAGVDLEVSAGEIVGLLGPNGAGKTTLVSIVAGLRRPDDGRVLVDGRDVHRQGRQARRRIGIAPQDLGIYPTATVRENLRFFAGLAGLARRTRDARVEAVAAEMALDGLLDRRAAMLSGGQKRRLHTAAAMVHPAPLLLLDEPTVGADVESRGMLLEAVARRARDGTAIVYTTHHLHELDVLDASVAFIERGRLLARGRRAELIDRYAVTTVELTFDGPVPGVAAGWVADDHGVGGSVVSGSTLRIPTHDPPRTVVQIVAELGEHADRMRSLEILRPGLEAVYLALTGRRDAEDVREGAGEGAGASQEGVSADGP